MYTQFDSYTAKARVQVSTSSQTKKGVEPSTAILRRGCGIVSPETILYHMQPSRDVNGLSHRPGSKSFNIERDETTMTANEKGLSAARERGRKSTTVPLSSSANPIMTHRNRRRNETLDFQNLEHSTRQFRNILETGEYVQIGAKGTTVNADNAHCFVVEEVRYIQSMHHFLKKKYDLKTSNRKSPCCVFREANTLPGIANTTM